jgi:hypothetical protein
MRAASIACGIVIVAVAQFSFAAQDKIRMKEKSPNETTTPSYKNIRDYISSGWDVLPARSMTAKPTRI